MQDTRLAVYLAGHMHHGEDDWRKRVIHELCDESIDWLIPTRAVLKQRQRWHAAFFGPRDKALIRRADIVFAFIGSPSRNLGTVWELGYAAGLGKVTVMVNTCTDVRGYDFAEQEVDSAFYSLEEGIEALRFIARAPSQALEEIGA